MEIEKFIENLEKPDAILKNQILQNHIWFFAQFPYLKKSVPVLSKMEYNGNMCGGFDSVRFLGQRTKENDSS